MLVISPAAYTQRFLFEPHCWLFKQDSVKKQGKK